MASENMGGDADAVDSLLDRPMLVLESTIPRLIPDKLPVYHPQTCSLAANQTLGPEWTPADRASDIVTYALLAK